MFIMIAMGISSSLFGQNVAIDFVETPDFINICGDVDTMIVQISADGFSTDTRTNVSAEVDLFKGVRLEGIDATLSSAGVSLITLIEPGRFTLSIPDISPASFPINVALLINADCTFQDSINANNTAQVLDTWDFTYDLGISTGLTETDITPQYRDAFKNPQFQMQINSDLPPLRLNDCVTREVQVDNSGLQGYSDSLIYVSKTGNGLTVISISANGIPLVLSKMVSGTDTDTLVTASLSSVHFALNTVGNGGPLANGDGRFDPEETLIITEELCYTDCSGSLASFHTVGWGCFGSICESADVQDFLDSGGGEGTPDGDVTPFDEPSFVDIGYCQSGSRAALITNQGSEFTAGFGSMMNVDAAVLTGNGSGLSDDGIVITEITIAGVVLTSPATFNRLDSLPAFMVDPDGPGVGLEDEDGDGFYDDLPIGNSFVVSYLFENQMPNRDSFDLDSNCDVNDIRTQMWTVVRWNDACEDNGDAISSFHRIRNLTNEVEHIPDSDAYTNGDTFRISMILDRSVSGFDKNCGGAERLITRVALSPGMIPVFSENNLFYSNGSLPLPAPSRTVVNDTLVLEYDVSGVPMGGDFTTVLAFTADCAISEGRLVLPTTTEFFCPSCDETHLWYCDEILGPQVHITSPPCAPPTCPEGLRALDFDVVRTTFGFQDKSYTIPYDPALANKKVAVECDSVDLYISAEVGQTILTDSAFARITYTNTDLTNSLEETFLFGQGELILKRGVTILGEEPITAANLVVNSDGLDKELLFNLDEAITNMGATLMPGDSVFFSGAFQVNSSGPFDNEFRQVPSLRGDMFSVRDGLQFSCDNFGDIFTLAKIRDVVSFPQRNSWPKGSNEGFVQFLINSSSTDFVNFFTNEYRPSIKVDSLVILFDPNIIDAYEVFEPEISIPNHPVHGSNYYTAPAFEGFADNRYIIRLDTFTELPDLNQVRSNEFNFRIRVIGSSEAERGSATGDSLYYFEPTLHYSNKYYARSIGDGACSEQIAHLHQNGSDNFFVYDEVPELNIIPQNDPNKISIGDTLSYEVRVCNISTLQSAGISWFSFVDSLSTFDLYKIEDITDAGNIRELTLEQYGTVNSWFGFADGLDQNIFANTFDERCNVFRITGKLNSCGFHKFGANSGWNSVPFSNPDWTPDSVVYAQVSSTMLTARSQDGNLEASVDQQPNLTLGLCDTNEMTIVIRNTDLGKVFDIRTRLHLPSPGLEIVPGSFEVAYPSASAFVPALSDPILINTGIRGDTYEYSDFSSLHAGLDMNGLNGFDNDNPSGNENQYLLKFKFTTDCDYLSGSQIFYDVQGFLGCGDPTNFESGETVPVDLVLPTANPNLSYSLRFDPKTAFVSNSDGQLNVIINNTGTQASSTADSMEIRLPANFDYVVGSANAVAPVTYVVGEPVTSVDGLIISYSWGLPNGVSGGDSIAFNFKVTSPTVSCGTDSIGVMAFTRANVAAVCTASGVPCQIEVVTSDADGTVITELPIYNQALLVTEEILTSVCTSTSTEQIFIDGEFLNTGMDLMGDEITLYYRLDANGDKILDNNDVVVDSLKLAGPITAGSSVPWIDSLILPSTDICGLYLYGDNAVLGGCDPIIHFVASPRILNAGSDIEHCSLFSPTANYQLGMQQCAPNPELTYTWSSLTPGGEAFLSDINIANPNLAYVDDGSIDTLIYVVETVRSGCSSTQDTILIDLDVCSCIPPEVVGQVITGSRCNESIGEIVLNLTVDESLYTYTYTEVFTNQVLTGSGPVLSNIPAGAYNVVIENILADINCLDSVLIAVPNIDGPRATFITTNASCSAADGTAQLLPTSFNYVWSDGGTGSSRTDLTAGTYVAQVESPNVPGCYNYIFIEIGMDNNLTATFSIDNFATCGVADGIGTIDVQGGSGNYDYSWSSGAATNNMLDAGVTLVTITDNDATGCTLTLPVLMTNGDQASTTITGTTDVACGATQNGAVSYDVVYEAGFVTPVDTIISNGTNTFTNGQLPEGFYCVLLQDAMGCIYGGDCFEIEKPDALSVDILLDPSCTSDRGIYLTPRGGNGTYTVDWNDIAGSNDPLVRRDLPSGSYGFSLSDGDACSLTFDDLMINDCNLQTIYISDSIHIDEQGQLCFDSNNLSSGGMIDTILNICPDAGGVSVAFDIDPLTNCINYTGLDLGRDSACIVICDAMANCDTLILVIDVVAGAYIRDTVIRLTDTVTYDLPTGILDGTIVDLIDNCPTSHGDDISFEIDVINNSVTYYGIGLGTDTICLELIDDQGGTHQTTLVVSSRDPIKQIYTDTIFTNQEVSYPFDISEIGLTAGDLVNECMTASDTSVAFAFDNDTFIIDYTGLLSGTDTACIVSCNAAGVCDTLEMRIHVSFFPDAPVAVTDMDTTLVGDPIVLNVAKNDTISGASIDLEIIQDDLRWGDATVNLDGTLTYNPDPEFCERTETFRYRICNENSCDTALVNIFIECTDIKVFNAISPNGDGDNDFLYIANIDDFPNNILRIYNRWNVLVYEIEGYQIHKNANVRWRGTWQDETDLPDGTYYYHLILNDEAQREFSGALTIFR